MPRPSRRRFAVLSHVLVLVLAVVALGLLMQPVLASMGELHELTQALNIEHVVADSNHDSHDDHDASLDDNPSAETGFAQDGFLDFLMHHAPCCSQSLVPLVVSLSFFPIEDRADDSARAELQHPPHTPVLAPFRPPIVA